VLSLAFLAPWFLAALQAGGGGSFGGGGGGGGGGGSGGDGDGLFWILYWLIRLAFEVPVIGVPLLLMVAILAIVGSRKGWWKHQERTIARARPMRVAHASLGVADQLRTSDPSFDEARFLGRVQQAFQRAQSSWCAQSLEPIRSFVSDGVFERFSLQIEEQQRDGWRQGMDGLVCGRLSLVHLEVGAQFDTLSVRIPFQADIHRLDLKSGKKIPGSSLPRGTFEECWSFVRRRGARSASGQGLMEGQCPNCGAPLSINQSARCGHCEALVRSGQFDWVLAEITQMSEWRPTSSAAIPGFANLARVDAGFDVQMLEDRASMAFWRKSSADRLGNAGPLERIATPAACQEYGEGLAAGSEKTRVFLGDCAVGAVNTLAVLAGQDRDRAVVEVVWDGRTSIPGSDGVRRLAPERRLRRTLFAFARPAGLLTPIEDTFTTATCRKCGAHDAGGTGSQCAYCGAPRTGERQAWMVERIVDRGTTEAAPLLAEIAQADRGGPARPGDLAPVHESATGLLLWAAALARSDGAIEPRERKAVTALAGRLGVGEARVAEMLDGPPAGTAPKPRDNVEALAWFAQLVELAMEDGSVSSAERAFLHHAAGSLAVRDVDAERVIRSVRTRLFQDSREAKRAMNA
jgi:hypothetical protein